MYRDIKLLTATYTGIEVAKENANKLRGFFADRDSDESYLHNHDSDGREIYRYPLVQYKIIGNKPVVVGIEEGIRSIYPHLMNAKKLIIGDREYDDTSMDIKLFTQRLGDSKEERNYRFLAPWIAINQHNYEKYKAADRQEKEELVNRILIGNILSICKAFHVTIEGELKVRTEIHETNVIYKGNHMLAFNGKFWVNAYLPNMCGIGKGTSRGFGTIKQIKERRGDNENE